MSPINELKTDEKIGRDCLEECRSVLTSTMLAELECRAAIREEAKELAKKHKNEWTPQQISKALEHQRELMGGCFRNDDDSEVA